LANNLISALVSSGVHAEAEEFAQWQVEINCDYHGKNMPGLPINKVAGNDMRKVMTDQRSFKVIQESIVTTRVMAINVSQLSGSMMIMSNQCQVIVEVMNCMTNQMVPYLFSHASTEEGGAQISAKTLTALVVSPFCVFHKILLLPTYPLSLRRN
jgi:hypothetical protein